MSAVINQVKCDHCAKLVDPNKSHMCYERRELLIGCGNRRAKDLQFGDTPNEYQNLTTLDVDSSCNPDVVWDLNNLPLPFADNTFDEIGAYEVLEHVGQQGDYKAFFALFTELHRILKPKGYLAGSCPMWDQIWAWGDPGHTRVITPASLQFLDQDFYADQVGKTACTDYRSIYKASFELMGVQERPPQFYFLLRKK
jgi:SAM-dependent methyltransferase